MKGCFSGGLFLFLSLMFLHDLFFLFRFLLKIISSMQVVTTEKYFTFLKDVHVILKNTEYVSLNKMCMRYSITPLVLDVLQENGIIEKGKKYAGNNLCWRWKSDVIPNIKMAEELKARCNSLYKRYEEERKGLKEINDNEPILETKNTDFSTENKKIKTFSLLWGMIKFDY